MRSNEVAQQIAVAFSNGTSPGLLIAGRVFWLIAVHAVHLPEACQDFQALQNTLTDHAPRVPGYQLLVARSPTQDFAIEGHIRIDSPEGNGMAMRLVFSADHVGAVLFETDLS